MNMNYCQMPYETDYSDDAGAKQQMMNMSQMSLPVGAGQAQPTSMPLSMPMAMNMPMNQMQLPMGNMASMPMQMPMSYPLPRNMAQSQPMGMLPQMPQMQLPQGNQMSMSPLSMPTMSQLPPGAVTPLSSTTMMPMMGGIDGGGMNVVVPDLQPLSAMQQMSPNTQMPQMPQMPQMQQQPGRMSGGSNSNTTNWLNYGGGGQVVPNNMWIHTHTQGYPNMQAQQLQQQLQQQQHQQQHQQHHQQQQQQQQHQQQQRMKSHYDYSGQQNSYREARNGLNSPSMSDSLRFSRGSTGSLSGKKIPHWR